MTTIAMKEMSYSELNSQIAELKQQQQALADKLSEMVSEMEHRKKEAINNWKLHTSMVLEDTKVLLEMGIDPQSLIEGVKEDMDCPKQTEPTSEPTNETSFEKYVAEEDEDTDIVNDAVEEVSSPYDKGHNNPLLTPFYKILGIKPKRKDRPETLPSKDTSINPLTGKRMVNRLLTPIYKLCADTPISKVIKIGNFKYKKSYPDPEEGRVVSANGCSPTLTYTHCDFNVWIGPKPDNNLSITGGELPNAA